MIDSNHAKQLLIRHLINQGYGSYAKKLIEIDKFVVADFYDGMRCETAFMVPAESTICVNPGFFELSDPNDQDEQKEMLDSLSVIVRHELLHYLLSHERRFVAYLKKKYPNSWGREYANPKMHTLANMAMDWDLCNEAYTEEDKKIVQHMKLNGEYICGLVTEENVKNDRTTVFFNDGTKEVFSGSQFNGWENKTMEEMWQMLHDAHNLYINKSPADFGDQTETQPGHAEKFKKKDASDAYNKMYDRIIAKFGNGKISKAEIMELAGRLNANRTDGEDFDLDDWKFNYSESLTEEKLSEAKLTPEEIDAALDALSDIMGAQMNEGDPGDGGNGPGQRLPQEYAEAWNNIIANYDNDNISLSDLQTLANDIMSGKIKELS